MRRKRTRKRVKFIILIVFLVIVGILGIKIWKYLSIGVQVVTNRNIELKQTTNNRINILLLGVGGGIHDGPDLTDTIIFASIDPKSKKTLLVSIPRDLWIPDLNAKINASYVYGEEKKKGGGLLMAKATVAKLLGQDVDYAVKIDFDGFTKAVDELGGLDITVDRTFDDYAYPIAGQEDDACGHTDDEIASISAQLASPSAELTEFDAFPCRYEHIHFDKGQTHINGTEALKYVRSRHALGPEGSDFARSRRQTKIISAIKDKVFSLDLFLNPGKVMSVINLIEGSIVTDIKEDEYDDFIRVIQKFRESKINSAVLDAGDSETGRPGLLMNPTSTDEYGGAWVLIPETGNGDYSEIHKYVDCEIKKGNCDTTPTPQSLFEKF